MNKILVISNKDAKINSNITKNLRKITNDTISDYTGYLGLHAY